MADAGHSTKFVEPDSPKNASTPHQIAGNNDLSTQSSGKSSSSNGSGGSERRKSTFMDKLKGEAKVLSGKMSHNEEKIEQGKKLMGKV